MGNKKDNKKDNKKKHKLEHLVPPAPEADVSVEVADPGEPPLKIVRAWKHKTTGEVHYAVDYGSTKLRRLIASNDPNDGLRKLLIAKFGLVKP